MTKKIDFDRTFNAFLNLSSLDLSRENILKLLGEYDQAIAIAMQKIPQADLTHTGYLYEALLDTRKLLAKIIGVKKDPVPPVIIFNPDWKARDTIMVILNELGLKLPYLILDSSTVLISMIQKYGSDSVRFILDMSPSDQQLIEANLGIPISHYYHGLKSDLTPLRLLVIINEILNPTEDIDLEESKTTSDPQS